MPTAVEQNLRRSLERDTRTENALDN